MRTVTKGAHAREAQRTSRIACPDKHLEPGLTCKHSVEEEEAEEEERRLDVGVT